VKRAEEAVRQTVREELEEAEKILVRAAHIQMLVHMREDRALREEIERTSAAKLQEVEGEVSALRVGVYKRHREQLSLEIARVKGVENDEALTRADYVLEEVRKVERQVPALDESEIMAVEHLIKCEGDQEVRLLVAHARKIAVVNRLQKNGVNLGIRYYYFHSFATTFEYAVRVEKIYRIIAEAEKQIIDVETLHRAQRIAQASFVYLPLDAGEWIDEEVMDAINKAITADKPRN